MAADGTTMLDGPSLERAADPQPPTAQGYTERLGVALGEDYAVALDWRSLGVGTDHLYEKAEKTDTPATLESTEDVGLDGSRERPHQVSGLIEHGGRECHHIVGSRIPGRDLEDLHGRCPS